MSELSDPSMTEVMRALDIVVLRRANDGTLCLFGTPPDWFPVLFSEVDINPGTEIRPGEVLFFLDNFLIDAESFWSNNNRGMLVSEFWTETPVENTELQLQATALAIDGGQYLLIGRLQDTFTEKQRVVQRARENALVYESLVEEIQKKDILLHAIVHDLTGPLTSMTACLDLLESREISEETHQSMIELGRKAAGQQKEMIAEILSAFSSDLRTVINDIRDLPDPPDSLLTMQHAIDLHTPSFTVRDIELELQVGNAPSDGWAVLAERDQLVRIASNLLENALRYSKKDTTVFCRIHEDGDHVRIEIEDSGPGVKRSVAGALFHSFVKGRERSGKSGLGLYFCRITLERWGGSIGVSPGGEGRGACFWIRLRRANPH
jgi:signal transduction histidine kinase